jgi:hypothetical protein
VGSGSTASSEAAEVENSQCEVLLTDQFSTKTSTESFLFRDQWANLQGEILSPGTEEDQELFRAAVGAGTTGYLL